MVRALGSVREGSPIPQFKMCFTMMNMILSIQKENFIWCIPYSYKLCGRIVFRTIICIIVIYFWLFKSIIENKLFHHALQQHKQTMELKEDRSSVVSWGMVASGAGSLQRILPLANVTLITFQIWDWCKCKSVRLVRRGWMKEKLLEQMI